ncbi:hypothetical protein [Streptomyces sp. CC208A]|uniref:hypothetical protein n=1 Tax=Streptomyces sp. CC208A TaxID=3044573 RepID=UPI0024A945C6|nr:hypothetical protein [Streptomyces sp. CC208A]
MPVTRRTYNGLQARYELALEQRDTARSSLDVSRSIAARYAEENDRLRALLAGKNPSAVTAAEHARLKSAYAALEQQLLDLQAANEAMCREAREKAEAAL